MVECCIIGNKCLKMNNKLKNLLKGFFVFFAVILILFAAELSVWLYDNYFFKKFSDLKSDDVTVKFHPGVNDFHKWYHEFYLNKNSEYHGRSPEGLNYKKKPIVIFGCSFAYGYLLNNEDTFSYKLSHLTKRPVYNRAYTGWGIQHMLYQVRDDDFFKTVPEPEYVIYVYFSDHIRRLFLNHFNFWEVSGERFYLRYTDKNGELVERTFPENPVLFQLNRIYIYNKICDMFFAHYYYPFFDFIFPLYKKSDIVKHFINPYKIYDGYLDFAYKHFDSAKKEMQKHWKNTKYVIFIYNNCPLHDDFAKRLSDDGFIVIRIEDITDKKIRTSEYTMSDGVHPNGKAWDFITPKLIEKLNL